MTPQTIYSKGEISTALLEAANDFIKKINSLSDEEFETSTNGKWSPGQNLDHLFRSVKPLNMAFSLPRFIPKWLFGKPRNPSRSFDAVVERYHDKLAKGGVASGAFVPPVISNKQRKALIAQFLKANHKLAKQIGNMSEETLDKLLLPHPLLGKLTFREMLLFTVYHTRHHLGSLNKH